MPPKRRLLHVQKKLWPKVLDGALTFNALNACRALALSAHRPHAPRPASHSDVRSTPEKRIPSPGRARHLLPIFKAAPAHCMQAPGSRSDLFTGDGAGGRTIVAVRPLFASRSMRRCHGMSVSQQKTPGVFARGFSARCHKRTLNQFPLRGSLMRGSVSLLQPPTHSIWPNLKARPGTPGFQRLAL